MEHFQLFLLSLIHHRITKNNIHLNVLSENKKNSRLDYYRTVAPAAGEGMKMFRSVQIIYSNLILQIFQLTIVKAIKIIVWNLFKHKNIFLLNWKFKTKSFFGWESEEARKLDCNFVLFLEK